MRAVTAAVDSSRAPMTAPATVKAVRRRRGDPPAACVSTSATRFRRPLRLMPPATIIIPTTSHTASLEKPVSTCPGGTMRNAASTRRPASMATSTASRSVRLANAMRTRTSTTRMRFRRAPPLVVRLTLRAPAGSQPTYYTGGQDVIEASTEVHGACPHDCYDTCGLRLVAEDGRITRIGPDPLQPLTRTFLCLKVNRYLERLYHPDRVLVPLKRVGDKGAGAFV